MKFKFSFLILGLGVVLSAPVRAEEDSEAVQTEQVPAAADASAAGDVSAVAPPKAEKKTVPQAQNKDTEGTKAADRFKADMVIKSQYELDGRPLEVDPD